MSYDVKFPELHDEEDKERIQEIVKKNEEKRLKKLGASLWCGTIVLLIVGFFVFGHFRLTEEQTAVVETFGVPTVVSKTGWNWCIPIVQRVTKVPKSIMGMAIGYELETNQSIPSESLMITKDRSFINVDLYVEYRVSDPIQAVIHADSYEAIIKNLGQSYIRDTVGVHDVDGVYTTDKAIIQAEAEEKFKKRIEEENIGYSIDRILIQDTEFPSSAIDEAFKNVESAKQSMEVAVNEAERDKSTRIPEMEANVDKILKEAEAYKQEKINEAKGQVARFEALYEEYVKFPRVTKKRLFYETMEYILPGVKVIIDTSEGTETILPLDTFSSVNVNENALTNINE